MLLKRKLDELHEKVKGSQNKGSFLMKLQHLRDSLPHYDGLGDYKPLYDKLNAIESEIQSIVEVNRERNLEIKLQLLEEAELYKDKEDWKEIAPFFRDFKMRWLKTGRVLEEREEEIETAFEDLASHFHERKKEYMEQLNIELAAKADKFDALIAKAEEFKDHPNLKTARFQFNQLFKEWKSLGKVPKSEEYDPWATFREISDHFYKRIKDAKAEKQRQPQFRQRNRFNSSHAGGYRQNNRLPSSDSTPRLNTDKDRLDFKLKLCQQAEGLRNMDPKSALEQAKELQELWKKSGLTPRFKKKELQDRFRNAIDIVYQKRSIYINARKLEDNYTSLSKADQIKTQIIALKAMIKDDELELKELEDNAHNHDSRSEVYSVDKILAGKVNEQHRKISVKKLLLHELELMYLASN